MLGCVIALLMLGGTALADGGPRDGSRTGAATNRGSHAESKLVRGCTCFLDTAKFGDAEWARIRQSCVNGTNSYENCLSACLAARDLWQRWKEGDFSHPTTSNWPPPTPNPTKHFQVPLPGGGSIEGYSGSVPPARGIEGPFPLPGGGKGIIMHIPPAPAATPTASGPQGFADPSSQHGSADHRASL